MRKRMAIIFIVAVIFCTIGFIEEAKDAHNRMAAQIKLNELMVQVENRALDLDALSDAEYMNIAHIVCELVNKIGDVTEATHYFRNCFTRAPSTLDEMIATILHEQGGTFGWQLMSREGTRFHMYGRNGEYNMKFISADGHFEVIYNIDGVKLTRGNDPMNMGTFNYGDPLRHVVYDVLPFFEWGNSWESEKQVNGLSDDSHPIDENDNAKKRFEEYWKLLHGEEA